MSGFAGPLYLLPPGSSGNLTGASVRLNPAGKKVAFMLVVEAAGATPQVTWRIEVSFDRDQVLDAAASWVTVALVSPSSDSPVTSITLNPAPAGSSSVAWLSEGGAKDGQARFARRLRVVTSANTNVSSYRCELTEQM